MNNLIVHECPISGVKYTMLSTRCIICGWTHDELQEKQKDNDNGLNQICFNKYKQVYLTEWENIIDDIELTNIENTLVQKYFKNPQKYDSMAASYLKIKAQRNPKLPHKCKICGVGDIEDDHGVCKICGWEDDDIQNEEPDYEGGANEMSFNQYRKFWEENKDEILKNIKQNPTFAIKKSQEYYKNHYEP